ncbi:hypothetical protein [Actinomyces sp. 432]|uniref:hypothetical protein n=1 Tax=Actinomyces sp. 432 TaxID=2057798 RepID=UPI00192A2534
MASLVAASETSQAAIATSDKAVARYGVPQRLLTDNRVAVNPTRRGRKGELDGPRARPRGGTHHRQAVQAHPQDKNERLHQTLFRYLDAPPLARARHPLRLDPHTPNPANHHTPQDPELSPIS